MRVSVLRAPGELVVEDRPVPAPRCDEVLVRIGSVGVCGSDVHYYEHGRIGSHVLRAPMVLGHEAGGEVVSYGADVRGLVPGQRVSLEPGVPCRACAQCLAGRYNLCPDMRFFATPPVDGALAEQVVLHRAFVHPVPDALSDDAAALLEPLSVGVWACRRGRVGVGSRVLVTGAGPIGLVAAQTALACGASEVVVTDVDPHRLSLARALGASAVDVATAPLAEAGFEPDVLLECSGNARATGDALSVLARAGRAVLVGMGGDELAIPLPRVQERELVLTGAFRYANTWPTAIALATSGRIQLDRLVTGHYGLDEVEQALTATRREATAVKSVIRPGAQAGAAR